MKSFSVFFKFKKAPYREQLYFLLLLFISCALASPAFTEDEDAISLSAGITRWYPEKKVVASGGVEASYKNFKITSDEAEADLETNIAIFKGNVKISTGEYNAQGELLTLNMKTKDWRIEKASSKLEPGSLQGNLQGSAFIHSLVLSSHNENLFVGNGSFTTCDLQQPHYSISAQELAIYPGNKIVARKVSFVGWNKRIFTLNSLVIPIKGFGESFVPQVGSSAEEGMFLKGAYAYTATENAQGFLKLDIMSKRGIGTGIEHSYQTADTTGLISLYYLFDKTVDANNLSGRIQHQQKLGSVNFNFTGDYRQNNYLYFPGTTSQDYNATFSHFENVSSTSLSIRRNMSSGYGNYSSDTISFRHDRRFSNKLSGQFSTDLRTYKSSSFQGIADREMESGFDLRFDDHKFSASLVASKRFDLDGDEFTGDQFYSSLDRLPEISVETDTYRGGMKLPFPARLRFTTGRYHEEPSGVTSDRFMFEMDILGKSYDFGKNELNISAGFRQAFYASDMAQYVLRTNAILTTRFSDYFKTRLAYNYQDPEGYSPFRFDYSGNYNYLRLVMDYEDDEELRWSLATGYDFRQRQYPWHDLTLRLTARPKDIIGYSISAGYNLNISKWRNLVTRIQLGQPDNLALDLGCRYDVELGKIALLRSVFDIPMGNKWRISGLIGWNGFEKKFDYRSIKLTRDLHCWEASLIWTDEVGFRKDRGIRLDFRIKAFPFKERFGIGQYGQAIDPSMGEFYY